MIRIIEGIQSYLKFLTTRLAECASSAVETSLAVQQIAEAIPAITRSLAEMSDHMGSIDERLNRYLADQAQAEGKVARIDKHVSEVREKLGLNKVG